MYKITRGQLITLWIFGILGWVLVLGASLESYTNGYFLGILFILIPFFLIFYTLGWKNKHKEIKQ